MEHAIAIGRDRRGVLEAAGVLDGGKEDTTRLALVSDL